MSITLEKKHIKTIKPIATIGKTEVDLIITYGGLHIIMKKSDGKGEFLGAGANLGVAKYFADKASNQKIKWNDE